MNDVESYEPVRSVVPTAISPNRHECVRSTKDNVL